MLSVKNTGDLISGSPVKKNNDLVTIRATVGTICAGVGRVQPGQVFDAPVDQARLLLTMRKAEPVEMDIPKITTPKPRTAKRGAKLKK